MVKEAQGKDVCKEMGLRPYLRKSYKNLVTIFFEAKKPRETARVGANSFAQMHPNCANSFAPTFFIPIKLRDRKWVLLIRPALSVRAL